MKDDLEIKLKEKTKAWVNEKPKPKTERMIRLTIDVAPDLHQKLKLKCVMERTTIADMIRGWMEEKLK